MSNLKETYNRIAEDWFKGHRQDDWWVEGTDAFISFLKPDALVLDVGCGGGVKSKYLIEKGVRVHGIDFSEQMIEIAKREVPEGKFQVLDLANIDTLDDEFDGIFMQAVLLHVPKSKVVGRLAKIVKKLKSGGYLYVAVKEKRRGGVDEEVKKERSFGYPYERFFSYFTEDEIKACMREIGLEIVRSSVRPSEKINWVQVIGRK